MRHYSKQSSSEGFVHFLERIVLDCGCGEKLILLGFEEDWRSEKSTFECECGARLTLADRSEGEALTIEQLLRGSVRALGT